MLNCGVDHILQEFYTLFLARVRTYKIATPHPKQMTSEDDIKGMVSLSSFVHAAKPRENRQLTCIGRHAERTGNPLLFVDRRIIEGFQQISYPVSRAYTTQKSEVWFLSLDDEPIRGSHFSSFLHI